MPTADHEKELSRLVDDLAGRFGSPRFQPHLTLVEDMNRGVGELVPFTERVVAGIAPFAATVEEIGASDLYFRSFYARFAASGPLLELKKRAIDIIAAADIADFMPHISLAYGVAETLEKRSARAEVENLLLRQPIEFDRLCVVASGKERPIADWAIRASATLSG